MKKTVRRTTAATICASLMLSGTCLAAPALAFAAGSGSGLLATIAGANTAQEKAEVISSVDAPTAENAATPEPPAPASGETTQTNGIAITVPSALVLDDNSSSNQPTWHDADGTVTLTVLSDVANETIDRAANDALAAEVIEGLGAELMDTEELTTNGGLKMTLYSFGVTGADGDFVGLIGLVQPEPNRLTAALAVVTFDADEDLVEAVEQAYYSVGLA